MEPTDDVGEASRLLVVRLSGSLLRSSSSSSTERVEGGCSTEPGDALMGVGAISTGGDGLLLLELTLLGLPALQPMMSEMKCGVGALGGFAYTCGCHEFTTHDVEIAPSVGDTAPTVPVTPV
jgi:hypothetical protein